MSSYPQLLEKIERLAGISILCVGDVMLDRYVYGEVTRISPEAPVPVLQIQREDSMLGGAGNVVRNLSSLGARVTFSACVGNDEDGQEVSRHLGKLPSCNTNLVVEPGRQTTVKRRFLSHGQQLLRADRETTNPIDEATDRDLLAFFRDAIEECNAVVLSDYAKGSLTSANTSQFIQLAQRANKPVVVDPKGRGYHRYSGASIIKPNTRELMEATGLKVETQEDIAAAARHLLHDTNAQAIVVTRGASGMMLVEQHAVTHFSSQAREVFDVSGAGDTVASTIALALGAGFTINESVYVANVAAGLVVAKSGTAVTDINELSCELRRLATN